MLVRCIRPIRFLIQGIAGADTPRQLALGFAIGMVIGLVPKGNLTAVALSMILSAERTPVKIAKSPIASKPEGVLPWSQASRGAPWCTCLLLPLGLIAPAG